MTVNPSFENEIYVRHDKIDEIISWYWLKKDHGAWDGPSNDWITSHSKNYFTNVKKFNVVVQAGGCLGMYPRLLSDIFDKVYTFEPDPLNFYCLTLNCQSSKIVKFNCALGASNKMVSLKRHHEDNVGMHCIMNSSHEGIPVLKIDDLALEECDLICLDVEAYETDVILGAMETIGRFKPVIVCENGNDSILNLLSMFDYEIQGRSVADMIYVPKENKIVEDIL